MASNEPAELLSNAPNARATWYPGGPGPPAAGVGLRGRTGTGRDRVRGRAGRSQETTSEKWTTMPTKKKTDTEFLRLSCNGTADVLSMRKNRRDVCTQASASLVI